MALDEQRRPDAGDGAGGPPIRVLYVDRREETLEEAVHALEREDRVVVTRVPDPSAVVGRLEADDPDVIVSELELGDTDALELLDVVRSRGWGTPFVILAERDRHDVAVRALNAGADHFVEKREDRKSQYLEVSMAVAALAARKRMGTSLLKEREFYRRMIDTGAVGMAAIDGDRRIVAWNSGMEKITGVSSVSAVGDSLTPDLSETLRSMLDESHLADALDGRPRIGVESSVPEPGSDAMRRFSVSYLPVPDGEQTCIGALLVISDTATNEVERSAAAAESNYRQLVELAGEGIGALDADNNISFANPRMAEITGFAAEEMVGKRLSDLVDEGSREIVNECLELCREGEKVSVDFEFMNRYGRRKYLNFRASPIIGSDGSYRGAVSVITDLTSRNVIEEALAEALERREEFERIVNASPVVVFMLLAEEGWPVTFVSDNVTQFGYTPDEFMSGKRDFASVVHPDDLGDVQSRIWEHIEKGDLSIGTEFRVLDKSGKTRWIDARALIRWDGSGKVTGLQGILLDVTDRIEGREAIERLALIVDSSMDAIIGKGLDGTILSWNPAAEALYGYTSEEAVGKPITMLVPDDRLEEFRRVFRAVRRGGRIAPFETVRRRKDGSSVDVSVTISPLKDSDGKTVGASAIVRDIGEKKRVEEALRSANQKLGLLGTITRHDVMNQIGILTGYLSLIEGDSSEEDRSEHLRAAMKACRNMSEQLQFAGSYQKAGTKEPHWVRTRLEFLGAASSLDLSGVSVTEDLGDLEVYSDPMFEKVFVNLLVNSRRHGERVTRVDASYEEAGDGVVIRYTDDGVGIPQDQKERIFERGFGRDSGLGLFLIREVLRITGMNITEVGTPGKGARFEIRVPKGRYRFA